MTKTRVDIQMLARVAYFHLFESITSCCLSPFELPAEPPGQGTGHWLIEASQHDAADLPHATLQGIDKDYRCEREGGGTGSYPATRLNFKLSLFEFRRENPCRPRSSPEFYTVHTFGKHTAAGSEAAHVIRPEF